ncbi:MAG: ATP phosphoribosyltransferase regulatory subunit [Firmicutes bacterium]|nr:ATP phosphoribosyltransferase regulatory subunit [Bacillota bacterium]
MRRWKTHTPEGALDILERECAIKREIENCIRTVYEKSGYFEIQTPVFEFYDVFADGGEEVGQTAMFKFFDRQGRILALRPDLTTPVARVCATKYEKEQFPKRISYVGSAFRDGDAVAGALQKQFTQGGAELVGDGAPEADAEVIALTIRALLACGLEDFQIDLGQAEFFKGVIEQAGLNDEKIEQIRRLTDQKSSAALAEAIKDCSIDGNIKDLILQLPDLYGGIDIALDIKRKNLGRRAAAALDNVIEIYNILKDYGLEKYIAIDLAMVQGLSYYTGVIVKGFARGVGFSVCGGGRYDNLAGEFGKSLPATGVAIGIERVISALGDKKSKISVPVVDTIVCYAKERGVAYSVAESLRADGLCVEMSQINDTLFDNAKSRKIGGIINVIAAENIEIINLSDGDMKITSIEELLGGEGK